MFKTILRNIFVLSAISFTLGTYNLAAQNTDKKPAYKKARVLQSSTAKQVVKVVEALERQKIVKVPDPDNKGKFIEKEEDDPDWITAKLILTELLNNRAEMKSYDRSVMWNYWGYLYFNEEDYDQAMYAYEQLA